MVADLAFDLLQLRVVRHINFKSENSKQTTPRTNDEADKEEEEEEKTRFFDRSHVKRAKTLTLEEQVRRVW